MSEMRRVEQSIVVETMPELAFEALTQASELREWFSDQAWTEPWPGGRYALHWNQGYHVEGRFLELESPRHAVVAWQGTGEPGDTTVEFTVETATEGSVSVTVRHDRFGPGDEWDQAIAEAQKGWQVGLENLKSTLETGQDLRLIRQPFLGIYLDLLTPERAEREGIDADYGIYVTGTVEGSGAEAAGLCSGDVVVAAGGAELSGLTDLGTILRAHQAGDTLDLEIVRGRERLTVPVTLGSRPQPEVPDTLEDLVARLAQRQEEVDDELRTALVGVSDEEAGQCPEEGQWSVKQILAHLSDGERAFHLVLVNMALNGWLDGGPIYPDQIPGRLASILAVAPTLNALLDRFLTDEAETAALVRHLPQTAIAHKARFHRIARQVIAGPDHTREHIDQIRRAIEAVRT
jgi:uncharacterized protein YndB with AHSA1/START domain